MLRFLCPSCCRHCMVVGGFMQWAILMPGFHAARLWKFLSSSGQDSGLQVVGILQ